MRETLLRSLLNVQALDISASLSHKGDGFQVLRLREGDDQAHNCADGVILEFLALSGKCVF